MTYCSCSFCGASNPVSQRYCGCGHEAHSARIDCRCPTCRRAAADRVTGTSPGPEQIATIADAVAEALAEIERRRREGK